MDSFIRLTVCLLLLHCTAFAHDYWLEAEPQRTAVGQTSVLRLMFGESFAKGAEKPIQPDRTRDFRLYEAGREYKNLPVPRGGATQSVAKIRSDSEGTLLVTMTRSPAEIRFGRTKFLEYAAVETGGEFVLPPEKTRINETYTRYLKTLVTVGDKPGKAALRTTGQEYEIVPLDNPYEPGLRSLRCKILFQGKPVSGALVTARQRLAGKVVSSSTRTDGKGRCAFPLTPSGTWLIRSVKIIPDVSLEGPLALVQSHWSLLTFGYE